MAEYDDRRAVRDAVLFRCETAADRQTHSEHVEVRRRNHLTGNEGRPLTGGENPANVSAAGNIGQRIDALLDVEEIGIRRGELWVILADSGVNLDKPVGLPDRPAAKKNRVDDREQRGVEANPERQRGDCGGGKPWVVKQLTGAVLQVTYQGGQHGSARFQLTDTLFTRRSFEVRLLVVLK